MWDITACRLGNFYRHFYGMRHPSSSGSSSLTYPKTQIFINTATVTSNIAQESSSFLCDKKKKKSDTLWYTCHYHPIRADEKGLGLGEKFFRSPQQVRTGYKIFTVHRKSDSQLLSDFGLGLKRSYCIVLW